MSATPLQCPTCGLNHPNCLNERARHSSPALTSFNNTRNKSAILENSWELEGFKAKLWKCKNEFRVFHCLNCDLEHARPMWCKDRFCPKCAKYLSRRAKVAIRAIVQKRGLWKRGNRHKLKFITLTCENFPRDKVLGGLKKLNKWFANLTRRRLWKEHVAGFLKRIEITKGEDGNYHLHIHALIEGSYVPQADLTDVWRSILFKDDWKGRVTYIQEVKGVSKAIKEIAKYAFKPAGLSIEDKAFLSKTLMKRRLYSFGSLWYELLKGIDIEDLDSMEGFICVCGNTKFAYVKYGEILRSEMGDRWKPYEGGFVFVPNTS